MVMVLERLVQAQNTHDPELFASHFTEDYISSQPAHPGRDFTGSAQVRANWAAVFAGVPDFHGELRACCREGDREWGELVWSGHHTDGTPFAMCGVIVATIRGDRIASARLYVEPVETSFEDIDRAVEQLYRPPRDET